jgi:hypothetical protein
MILGREMNDPFVNIFLILHIYVPLSSWLKRAVRSFPEVLFKETVSTITEM